MRNGSAKRGKIKCLDRWNFEKVWELKAPIDVFFSIHISLMLLREYTLSKYDGKPSLATDKTFVIIIDSSFVEQVTVIYFK